MNRRTFIHLVGLSAAALMISGCTSAGTMSGQAGPKGPPPHAPAHGHRKKNRQGVNMMYDSNLGVYVLMYYPMHYYWEGTYYRKGKDDWETTNDIKNKWNKINMQNLPKGLQNK